MIEDRCFAPDVDRGKISREAQVSGASYLTGSQTSVGPGAIVRDTRLHDAVIDQDAQIIDSICVSDGHPHTHKCDPAGRTVVGGVETSRIGEHARVSGCTLTNTSVGPRTHMTDTWAKDCAVGDRSRIVSAKLVLVSTGAQVTVEGPTEVSEAYLGHHARIERRGYFEGVFTNALRKLRFNESEGRLEIVEVVDLPHVSIYGVNCVNSSNSGKLSPQPDGVIKGFGKHVGLWYDELLSHEPIELGPCCWVLPWTKVIGQSPTPHQTDEEMINDEFATCMMPFSMVGFGGDLTRALVAPGELSVGLGTKRRRGGWVFTYCPDGVIKMVRRVYQALEPDRRDIADTVVRDALQSAIEITKYIAHRNRVDLSITPNRQRPGWKQWAGRTYALLRAHLDNDLWVFANGEPVEWCRTNGKWTHPRIDAILRLTPDAMEKQLSEDEIFSIDASPSATSVSVSVPSGAIGGSGGDAIIDGRTKISPDAFIGPGCRIGLGTVVEGGAVIWNSILERCKVAPNARIERSILSDSSIGENTVVRSCRITDSTLGADSTADAAAIAGSQLGRQATVCAFADVSDVTTRFAAILGGPVRSTEIETYLMSMHMAGSCEHLKALPTVVQLDGDEIVVPAIPMLGGGSVIRGTGDAPVTMECCFIGSNAILEANTHVGFGCFVLGTLGPDAGLLPFTVSTGGGAQRDQIGAVLGSMASTVMTHFINWTFQAVGPDGARGVAAMTHQAVQRGLAALEWELSRRSADAGEGPSEQFAQYRSLPHYTQQQLEGGMKNYQKALECGAWEITVDDAQLWFLSGKGQWTERNGSAFWKKR